MVTFALFLVKRRRFDPCIYVINSCLVHPLAGCLSDSQFTIKVFSRLYIGKSVNGIFCSINSHSPYPLLFPTLPLHIKNSYPSTADSPNISSLPLTFLHLFLGERGTVIVKMRVKMQQIQVSFQTPTDIYLQMESNQIWILITFM